MRKIKAEMLACMDFYDTIPPRPQGEAGQEWDAADPLAPLGQPVGNRIQGRDWSGHIVLYDHLSKHYRIRYEEDRDSNTFRMSELDTYPDYYEFMHNRAPAGARVQVPGHVPFAAFDPIRGSYADTVAKAGGLAFLAELFRENRLFELRDNQMPTSVPANCNTRKLLVNATKQVLGLCPLFPLGSDEREIMRAFAHYLPQLLHAQSLRHQDIQEACSLLSQGKWRQLWKQALDRAAAHRAKMEANPAVERQRSAKEKEAYAVKCATSGNGDLPQVILIVIIVSNRLVLVGVILRDD